MKSHIVGFFQEIFQPEIPALTTAGCAMVYSIKASQLALMLIHTRARSPGSLDPAQSVELSKQSTWKGEKKHSLYSVLKY